MMTQTTCSIEECEKPAKFRGWCKMHYTRWQRHGDPNVALKTFHNGTTCSVHGCGRPATSRDWCHKHYMNWRRTGKAVADAAPRGLPTLERLLRRVSKTDSCWLWTGALNVSGYGIVLINGKAGLAHRAMYELMIGPIPNELQLDHLCHVACRGGTSCIHRRCVNPQHLQPVSQGVNVRRGIESRRTSGN